MSPRRAFTLLEVTVSLTLLLGALALISKALGDSATAARHDMARNEALAAARRLTQQITRELSGSGGHRGGADHCTPTRELGAVGADTLTFAVRTGLSGDEAADWSAPITYRLVANGDTPGNLQDEDRDGVWDERRLERVHAGRTFTLDESVTLFRVDRDPGSDLLTITIEVARPWSRQGPPRGPRDWARARLVTSVLLRNRA